MCVIPSVAAIRLAQRSGAATAKARPRESRFNTNGGPNWIRERYFAFEQSKTKNSVVIN